MRDKVHFRWSCSWIDLRGDGRFAKEMVKGDVKKILQRDTRRRLKKELDEDIKSWQKCPNGWEDCDLCKYVSLDNICLYPKSDIEIVILAANISEEVMHAVAVESAEEIKRGTWAEHFKSLSPDEALEEFYRYKHPDLNYKEPLIGGPPKPGGGSKSRRKKSTKENIPTMYMWGSTD